MLTNDSLLGANSYKLICEHYRYTQATLISKLILNSMKLLINTKKEQKPQSDMVQGNKTWSWNRKYRNILS